MIKAGKNKQNKTNKTTGHIYKVRSLKKSFSTKTSRQFLNYKRDRKKKLGRKFKSENFETYNKPFILPKLRDAIQRYHNSNVGPGEIHYELLIAIPPPQTKTKQKYLQTTVKDIWGNGKVLKPWKQTTIMFLSEPEKNSFIPEN